MSTPISCRFGASATLATPGMATTDAAVITRRGPNASMCRPTRIPTPPERIRDRENAPVTATLDQPVSVAMEDWTAANA
ncbi:hypothetical protein [Nocardioides houyundeii]|uniref:hypothetical protein n=1 Tax=Nocardioides houyundeii TaxID=2045452 RepID=UPI0013159AA0|nr:hypothetical protein [Nocardioides houyundeii]